MLRRLALLGLVTALLAPPQAREADAAQNCIATYDRKGTVTGRYCSDGPADPTGEAVEESLPPAPAGGRRAGGRRVTPGFPAGVDIRCGGKGQRCRGTFTLR
jgi:hypothetical protein